MTRLLVAATTCALAVAAQGCSSDLFHDTSWPSACELDPSTPGCPGDAGRQDAGDAASDVKAASSPEAAAD